MPGSWPSIGWAWSPTSSSTRSSTSPEGGLFGIGRTEARIRARVKPISREKPADRAGGARASAGPAAGAASLEATRPNTQRRRRRARPTAGGGDDAEPSERPAGSALDRRRVVAAGGGAGRKRWRRGERRYRQRGAPRSRAMMIDRRQQVDVDTDTEDVDIEAQADRAASFTRSLVDAMGLSGTVSARVDDDTVLVAVDGDGLGLLVGPRGSTLQAIEELVARRGPARPERSERATSRRRRRVPGAPPRGARRLRPPGRRRGPRHQVERGLEPMSPPDRKVVHDTVADIDGVATSSEGEEPRRRVVISPA